MNSQRCSGKLSPGYGKVYKTSDLVKRGGLMLIPRSRVIERCRAFIETGDNQEGLFEWIEASTQGYRDRRRSRDPPSPEYGHEFFAKEIMFGDSKEGSAFELPNLVYTLIPPPLPLLPPPIIVRDRWSPWVTTRNLNTRRPDLYNEDFSSHTWFSLPVNMYFDDIRIKTCLLTGKTLPVVSRVLAVTEICQVILSFLPSRDLLLLRRVFISWADTIQHTLAMREDVECLFCGLGVQTTFMNTGPPESRAPPVRACDRCLKTEMGILVVSCSMCQCATAHKVREAPCGAIACLHDTRRSCVASICYETHVAMCFEEGCKKRFADEDFTKITKRHSNAWFVDLD